MGKEKEIFDAAICRAEHFCSLYELVHQNRGVRLTQETKDSIRKLLKINKTDSFLQIAGGDKSGQRSLLFIYSPSKAVTREEFEHEYASDLLRSAIVSAVAALDKYMHLVVVNRCFTLLRGAKNGIPTRLLKLEVPAIAAFETAD